MGRTFPPESGGHLTMTPARWRRYEELMDGGLSEIEAFNVIISESSIPSKHVTKALNKFKGKKGGRPNRKPDEDLAKAAKACRTLFNTHGAKVTLPEIAKESDLPLSVVRRITLKVIKNAAGCGD